MPPRNATDMERVELTRDVIGLFCLTARINGAEATFLVDSGATHTILDRAAMELVAFNQRRALTIKSRA
jgi:predicted aspartyl protease